MLAQSSNLPIGTWQVHVPHNRAKAVTETPNAVYCATEDGFFRYVKAENRLQVLSRNDGFNDVNLSTVLYDSVTATLIVAYENTNLDLVQEGKVINLTDLLRKPMSGIKTIHHVYAHEKKAYVATSFGLVVVDLVKLEIKDTYSNLGEQGEVVQVFSSTVLNDSLYIATSRGIMGARLSSPNLLDYKSWKRFGATQNLPLGVGAEPYKTIATFDGSVYAGIHGTGIYRFTGTGWVPTAFSTTGHQFRSMVSDGKRLVIAGPAEVIEVPVSGQATVKTDPKFQDLRMAVPARGGGQWIASFEQGLLKSTTSVVEAFMPSGPAFVDVFSVYAEPTAFTVLGGGYSQTYLQRSSNAGYYQYQNGQWTSYNGNPAGNYPSHIRDLVAAIRNPVTGKFYIASYGGGLLEFNGEEVTLYNASNSPLLSADLSNPQNNGFVRVTGLATDLAGSLWVVNRNQQPNAPGIFELKPDNTWKSHALPGFALGTSLDKILVDDQGYKWVTISLNASGAGLVVYDDVTGDYKYIGASNSGGLPGGQVFSMALDLNGEVWVGTNNGVAVFTSSSDIFTPSYTGSYQPIYERRPLLQGQIIRSIAVDGGNRKWIGTDTGLWLFNETGEELIFNFTTKNSPLPSDKIIGISINQATGGVLVGTEGGVAIYRGAATLTEQVNTDCLQVFPNPVRAGFTGTIGISGVPNNGWVKITDAAGFLVYEGKPNGGTFAWNGLDYNGRKAKAGVYLILAASADGSQTCVTKVAIQ
ncbi:MAG: hypothetical protein ACO1OQ_13720 [Rufibacter sp.]